MKLTVKQHGVSWTVPGTLTLIAILSLGGCSNNRSSIHTELTWAEIRSEVQTSFNRGMTLEQAWTECDRLELDAQRDSWHHPADEPAKLCLSASVRPPGVGPTWGYAPVEWGSLWLVFSDHNGLDFGVYMPPFGERSEGWRWDEGRIDLMEPAQ